MEKTELPDSVRMGQRLTGMTSTQTSFPAPPGDEEIERRRANWKLPQLKHDSLWQKLYREHVGQLQTGACLEFALPYRDLRKVVPRHSH